MWGIWGKLGDRSYPQWTVARANQIMHQGQNDKESAAELAACTLLASNWQQTLSRRAKKSHSSDSAGRLFGEN